MFKFGGSQLGDRDGDNSCSYQLDRFVQENQQFLAAIAWGLLQEWGESKDVLGIDLRPQPHFVCCARAAIEELNQKVDSKIQEILGVLDGYNSREEVVIIGIGEGKIKLINFRPDPLPPACFEQFCTDLESLIQQIERQMVEQLIVDG